MINEKSLNGLFFYLRIIFYRMDLFLNINLIIIKKE